MNVLAALGDEPVRFITLTVKHTWTPLNQQLDRLYLLFARLRDGPLWKRHVRGGAAFLEVVWSERSNSWHSHLHCLVHGSYFPREVLSAEWYRVTGDSMVVDIRLVKDKPVIGRYVTKYVSKPLSNTFLNRPTLLDEFTLAMKSRRLCLTFGDWRGIRLTAPANDVAWEPLGAFFDVLHRASTGDEICLEAIHAVCGSATPFALAAVPSARPPPPIEPRFQALLSFQWNASTEPY